MDNEQAPSSIGRRDILKKSAVVAATAWTAPMIVSSKVGASSGGTCLEVECRNTYVFKVEVPGSTCEPFQNTPCASSIQGISSWVEQACIPGASGGYSESNGGSIVLPAGNEVVGLIGKKYPTGCFNLAINTSIDGQCRQTVALPKGYSHIYVVVCSELSLLGSPVLADASASEQLVQSGGDPAPTTQAPQELTTEANTTTTTEPPPTTEPTTTTTTEPPPTTEATTTTTTEPPPTTEATTTTAAVPEP